MQYKKLSLVVGLSFLVLSGCKTSGMDLGGMMDAGLSLTTAATLSDADIKAIGDKTIAQQDASNKIASAGSKHGKRLASLTADFKQVDGFKLDYKVYANPDVNAFAVPNGSIRVMSGLLDKMNDDEVRYVLAHEIGHVVLGHSKKAFQVAYASSAARQAAAASGNAAVSAISTSQLGELGEALIGAQFSQKQEYEADDFAVDFLKSKGHKTAGAVTALRKLEKMYGNDSSFFASHPASGQRAARLEQKLAQR